LIGLDGEPEGKPFGDPDTGVAAKVVGGVNCEPAPAVAPGVGSPAYGLLAYELMGVAAGEPGMPGAAPGVLKPADGIPAVPE
jgi:hypothetical protein